MKTTIDLIKERHSVRQFQEKDIEPEKLEQIANEISQINKDGNLHFQLVSNEKQAFDSAMAHYGKFSNVNNYIVLIGPNDDNLDEKCGYYGEKIVLKIQELGLNSCFVAMTYKKIPSAFKIDKGEKLKLVIALGYGKTQGFPHKSKDPRDVFAGDYDSLSEEFKEAINIALLAPTAMNQQKFVIKLVDNKFHIEAKFAFYSKIDLGIVKYNFEQAVGKENCAWNF